MTSVCSLSGVTPASAALDLNNYEQVVIGYDELYSMFAAGDLSVTCTVFARNGVANVALIDLLNDTSEVIPQNTTETRTFNLFNSAPLNVGSNQGLLIYGDYLLNKTTIAGYCYVQYDLQLPFEVYLQGEPITVLSYVFGDGFSSDGVAGISTFTFNYTTETGITTNNIPDTAAVFSVDTWSSDNERVSPYYSLYPDVDFDSYLNFSYVLAYDTPTIDESVSTFSFNDLVYVDKSSSSADTVTSPLAIALYPITAYVPIGGSNPDGGDITPEYGEAVKEYLDKITNPTPENVERVEQLRDVFEEIDNDLGNISDELAIEKPDISGSIDDIPDELQSSVNNITNDVLSPLLNAPFMLLLFTGIFAICYIKLILFGSGPH